MKLQDFKACVGASDLVVPQSAKMAGTRNHSVLNSSKEIKTVVGVHMARRHAKLNDCKDILGKRNTSVKVLVFKTLTIALVKWWMFTALRSDQGQCIPESMDLQLNLQRPGQWHGIIQKLCAHSAQTANSPCPASNQSLTMQGPRCPAPGFYARSLQRTGVTGLHRMLPSSKLEAEAGCAVQRDCP